MGGGALREMKNLIGEESIGIRQVPFCRITGGGQVAFLIGGTHDDGSRESEYASAHQVLGLQRTAQDDVDLRVP